MNKTTTITRYIDGGYTTIAAISILMNYDWNELRYAAGVSES